MKQHPFSFTRFCTLIWLFVFGAWLPLQAVPAKELQAQAMVTAWIQLIDEGKYESAWKQTAPFFMEAISVEDWVSSLNEVRKPLGAVKSRQVKRLFYTTMLPGAPEAEYVVVQFETVFAGRDLPVLETITPMLVPHTDNPAKGTWKVSGYYIQ